MNTLKMTYVHTYMTTVCTYVHMYECMHTVSVYSMQCVGSDLLITCIPVGVGHTSVLTVTALVNLKVDLNSS